VKYTPARLRLGPPGVVANARDIPGIDCAAVAKCGLALRTAAQLLGCDLSGSVD